MAILILGDFYYGDDKISEDILLFSEYIKKNNINVILNLEGVITRSSGKIKKRGEHLKQTENVIEILKLLNVKGVTLANNHIFDFGEQGLRDTIEILDAAGIKHTGAGFSLEEALTPIEIYDSGEKYYIYSMTDEYEEGVCINKKQKAGCVPLECCFTRKTSNIGKEIFILHSGFEYNVLPMPRNIKQYRQLIDIGAELVIGMHPHVVQPIEVYKGKIIAYSLGNFYFSTFIDEFSKKIIRNKPEGYCNLGYGIFINNPRNTYLKIQCNQKRDKIFFMEFNENKEWKNELKSKMDVKYFIKYLRNRNNYNPILFNIKYLDDLSLLLLKIAYWLYRTLKLKRLKNRN